jgi:hypothetical protein
VEANMEDALARSVTAEAMTGREMQEVKAMVFMAKQYPRNENASLDKILKACERKTLAEKAIYEYPRGDVKVNGPSIRLAEAIAQNWGNFTSDIVELEQHDGESVVMARAWDIETNVQQRIIFTVPHIRHTRSGGYKLTDPRDIYEMVANQGARRRRACILGLIPGDVIEAAVNKCNETLTQHVGKRDEALARTCKAFEEYNVTQAMLEKFIGCNANAFTSQDIIRLGNVYTSIKDGMGKPGDYFEGLASEESSKTTNSDRWKTLAAKAKFHGVSADDAKRIAGEVVGKKAIDAWTADEFAEIERRLVPAGPPATEPAQ